MDADRGADPEADRRERRYGQYLLRLLAESRQGDSR